MIYNIKEAIVKYDIPHEIHSVKWNLKRIVEINELDVEGIDINAHTGETSKVDLYAEILRHLNNIENMVKYGMIKEKELYKYCKKNKIFSKVKEQDNE